MDQNVTQVPDSINSGTIAVTGASGFIGRYLCAELEAAGFRVLRLSRGQWTRKGTRQTDYSEASLVRLLRGADAVIHLAGRRMNREDALMDIAPFLEPNVAVVGNLARAAAAAGLRKIVLASTIGVYSPVSGVPYREASPPRPVNAYALSKLVAEAYLEMLTRDRDPAAVSLRLGAVYGYGERGTPVLMRFVDQASRGETIVVTGNADTRIDQVYVGDVCTAVIAALRAPVRGVYNIGGGVAWSLREIAETVNDVFGNSGNIRFDVDSDAPMPQTVMALDRAIADLGWRPSYDLRAGLESLRRFGVNPGYLAL